MGRKTEMALGIAAAVMAVMAATWSSAAYGQQQDGTSGSPPTAQVAPVNDSTVPNGASCRRANPHKIPAKESAEEDGFALAFDFEACFDDVDGDDTVTYKVEITSLMLHEVSPAVGCRLRAAMSAARSFQSAACLQTRRYYKIKGEYIDEFIVRPP